MKNKESQEDTVDKRKKLEWYVDFVNMDLETIKPGDKAKLLIEAEGHIYPDIGSIDLSEEELIERSMSEDKDEQKEAKVLLQMIKSIPDKETKEHWEMVLNLQVVIKNLFYNFQKRTEFSVRRLSDMIVLMSWGGNHPFEIYYQPVTDSNDKWVKLWIFNKLNGFPGHAINICPVCNKFFLNTSLRKKTFCSPKCMWRANAAKRRKENPEGYREYQREIMRKKYLKERDLENQKIKPQKKIKTDDRKSNQ